MWGGESFMEIEVNNIKTHVARPGYPHHSIQVSAVHVKQCSSIVNQLGDLQYLRFKQPQSIGVGEHQCGHILAQGPLQLLHIHQTPGVGFDLYRRETGGYHRGRVGSVRRIRDDDL